MAPLVVPGNVTAAVLLVVVEVVDDAVVDDVAGVVDDDRSAIMAIINDSCRPMDRTGPLVAVAYGPDGGIAGAACADDADDADVAGALPMGVPSALVTFTSGGTSINALILCDITGVLYTILDAA